MSTEAAENLLAVVPEADSSRDNNNNDGVTARASAAAPTKGPKKRKRKQQQGLSSASKTKKIKCISGIPSIDLSGVPPQPLILKNTFSSTGQLPSPTSQGWKLQIHTGVYFETNTGKWKSQIMVNGIVRSLGYYEKEEEAAADYARAAYKYKAKNTSKEGCKLYGGLDLSSIPEQPLIRNSKSTTGYKGVKKLRNRWQARINTGGGSKYSTLGTFDTVEEAAGIYARAFYYLSQKKS
ncbi:LOW QUALITY PROTEIN: hypothetical protein ACHAXR_006284 [Thalassiosira sp. AJA248-18]